MGSLLFQKQIGLSISPAKAKFWGSQIPLTRGLLSDIDGKFLLLLPDAISRFLALHT